MRLEALLVQLPDARAHGDLSIEVGHVTRDSRDVRPDSVFVAVRGARVDGHAFVADTAAAAVVVERDVHPPPNVVVIRVPDTKRALGQIAAILAGHPSAGVPVVGVTGTNGKTTVTTLVEGALLASGRTAARAGTTGWFIGGTQRPSDLTTPEAPGLQAFLADARDAGCAAVALEVSSIGLDQHRVTGTRFHTAVLTNLRRDHLDYHGTIDAYIDAKSRLFTDLLRDAGGPPRALLCSEEPQRDRMGAPSDQWTYGFGDADVGIAAFTQGGHGMDLGLVTPMGPARLSSPLVGRYNALNLAAALGVLLTLGLAPQEAADALGQVSGVPGRLETVPNDLGLVVLVDYAHTADALEAALSAVRGLTDGTVWVVFGCGGDRDAGKRPEMGRVAEALADRVVVTSDNPRTEDPQQIVDAILAGMSSAPTHVDVDRRAAIAWTVAQAAPGDAILVAGKGHETYQDVGGTKLAFDDRVVAAEALSRRAQAEAR
ncbi:MAG: UDP-N-acetylmuramoyl-L-alanyl-D-glutamate--2,6-diaminopimelate ligase [Deltaproteobacteria bacterium]|nr:MAG: UDP-N-acetylmuramoyl-L-alanyl-D-glutamate--2,6-diaminopimelate ligase [Deltaproteobacteria bacterium]